MILDECDSKAAKQEQYFCPEDDFLRKKPSQEVSLDQGTQKIPEFTQTTDSSMPGNFVNRHTLLPNETTESSLKTNILHTSCETFDTAQHIKQEQLEHEEESVVNDSGLSTPTSMSYISMSSNHNISQEDDKEYNVPPESTSSYSTYYNSGSTSTDTGSDKDKNEYSVYKFKHNFTKRFSLEKHNTIDASALSFDLQERKSKVKKQVSHDSSHSPSSCSPKSPNSEVTESLPGFILHPPGTHYVPLTIHPNVISSELSKLDICRPAVLHPINIQVNFSGPRLCIRSIQE